MYMPESIAKNPFHVLGASVTDGKRRLIERTDEAALLGEDGAEAALSVLLHANRRLEAEVNWFPGADDEAVQSVMGYPDEKSPAAFVDTDGMTHMAKLNACRVMLEAWPVTDESSAYALCASMAIADGGQSAAELLAKINEDRQKAGIPAHTNLQAAAEQLDAVRRHTARRLHERMAALPEDVCLKVLDKAAILYKQRRSPMMEMLINVYELQVYDRAGALIAQMDEIQKNLQQEQRYIGRKQKADQIYNLLDRWGFLTLPVRRLQSAKGYEAKDSQHVYQTVLTVASILNNTYGMVEDSHKLHCQMQEIFFNLPNAQILLENNRRILEKALHRK